jgi:hypothetical protein
MQLPFHTSIARILGVDGQNVTGAGFLISHTEVVTCAHVVAQALELSENIPTIDDNQNVSPPLQTLVVNFIAAPQEQRNATVVEWYPQANRDIAVLRLESACPAMASTANMLELSDMWGHAFRAFGFPGYYDNGVWADGRILGPDYRDFVQLECANVAGHRIEQGFSGTPVWDADAFGVVGMVVEADRQRDTKTAFMLPTSLLLRTSHTIKHSKHTLSIEQPKSRQKKAQKRVTGIASLQKFLTRRKLTICLTILSILIVCVLTFSTLNSGSWSLSSRASTETINGTRQAPLNVAYYSASSPYIKLPDKNPENTTPSTLLNEPPIGVVQTSNASNPSMYHLFLKLTNQTDGHTILVTNIYIHIKNTPPLPQGINVWHPSTQETPLAASYTRIYNCYMALPDKDIEVFSAKEGMQPEVTNGGSIFIDIGLSSTCPTALDFTIQVQYVVQGQMPTPTESQTPTIESQQDFQVLFFSDTHTVHPYRIGGASGKFIPDK